MTAPKHNLTTRLAGAAVIVLLAAIAYIPALSGQFVWDDNSWTTDIPQLVGNLAGLEKMWFQATALQQYYPLTGTTFWIDHQLWGFNTLPYHVENILLHITSALLFWALLRRLEVPGAWLAGAIFAVHPVMVESVAWITERKNVLSMVLFLSSILAYGRFTRFWKEDESQEKRDWLFWLLALALFMAALLAKATAFCLPAVLLLLCWWKRGKIAWKRDLLPTLPFFLVSIVFCHRTSLLETTHVGATGPEWQISFSARCLIAGRVVWFYVGKLLWPTQLCFLYPRWILNPASWHQWLFPIGVILVLATLWILRPRTGRGPLTAFLYFVGTLFPALGFMNAYFMRFSFVCDHWVYLSSLGLFALAAALITTKIRSTQTLYGIAALLLCTYAILTWKQCAIYSNLETLWRDTLAKNPNAWMADYNLGYLLQTRGDLAESKTLYERALQSNPNCDEADNNLAWLLATLSLPDGGDPPRAVTLAQSACRATDFIDPNRLDTLAVAYASAGRFDDAIATTQTAINLAQQAGQTDFIKRMEARLTLYREGHPYSPAGS
jgi:tetratricopeptide (TPR) repeat protein